LEQKMVDSIDLDSFLVQLPRTRRKERLSLIRHKMDEIARTSNTEELMRGFLERIASIGRDWEKRLIRQLQQLIESEPESQLTPLISAFLEDKAHVALVLHERDTGAGLRELEGVLSRLERLPKNPRPILHVNFETPHAYVYGLCAIAAWAAAHAKDTIVESRYPRVDNFIKRAGFLEGLRDPSAEPVRFDTETILGFTRIDPTRRFESDLHASRLVELFQKQTTLTAQTAQALSISFAELIENAIKHGEIRSPAWLFANYHPQPKLMHVCICDRGVGVHETFEQSSDPRLRELATHPTNWIREATEPLVTSKAEGHAGYGLFLARELCRRNGGRFGIISGNAAFGIHPRSQDSNFSEVEELNELPVAWNGTLVAIQFRLDRPLELGPIYDTLPSPDSDDDTLENVSLFDD